MRGDGDTEHSRDSAVTSLRGGGFAQEGTEKAEEGGNVSNVVDCEILEYGSTMAGQCPEQQTQPPRVKTAVPLVVELISG